MNLLVTTLREQTHDQVADLRCAADRATSAIERLTRLLQASRPLLAADAHVVVTARPRQTQGVLIDLASKIVLAGLTAGLVPIARCAALTAGVHGSQVLTRASFAQRHTATGGVPQAIPAHHDVIVFRRTPVLVAPACCCAAAQAYTNRCSSLDSAAA